jgi:hypothetical protein
VQPRVSLGCDASRSIVLEENPLADFVELPEHLHDLRWAAALERGCLRVCSRPFPAFSSHSWRRYSNIYCGVIRGALEMVNIRYRCTCGRCAAAA